MCQKKNQKWNRFFSLASSSKGFFSHDGHCSRQDADGLVWIVYIMDLKKSTNHHFGAISVVIVGPLLALSTWNKLIHKVAVLPQYANLQSNIVTIDNHPKYDENTMKARATDREKKSAF